MSAVPQKGGPPLPSIPGQRYLPAASVAGQGADQMAFGAGIGAGPPGGMPGPGMAAPQAGPSRPVTLDDATAAFQAVSGIQGRVFLVGEIVSQGQSSGLIEVAVTNPADRQTLSDALPQYQLSFHVVRAEPTEPHVEVTPGSVPSRGGGAAPAAQLVGV